MHGLCWYSCTKGRPVLVRTSPTLLAAIAIIAGATTADRSMGAASTIPDFSGRWARNAFDHEHMPSGPVPMTNMLRRDGDTTHPLLGGDPIPLIGNYDNPILKPEAVAVIKKANAIAEAGKIVPDPSNQCSAYQ